MPNLRKARDGSPGTPQNQLISRNPGTTAYARRHESYNYQALPISPYSTADAESYELSPSGGFANSRAIDIASVDPNRHHTTIDYIYYTVQPGDTLQNLSVKYSCPVASIKRLNNLWSDQEFYGLARLKLPVGKLRLIADVIDEERTKPNIPITQQQITAQPESTLGTFNQFATTSTPELQTHHHFDNVNYGDHNLDDSIFRENLTNSRNSDSIFKNLDLNIAKARTAARSYDNNANAIFQSLVESGNIVDEDDDLDDPTKVACREAEILLNDMSDYGLSYSGLILFIFIVCLICPLAYVIYLEETHHDSNKAP